MNRRQKIVLSVTGIFLVLLILVGLTYAYFLTRINGNTNSTSVTLTTADLELTYGDGNGILNPYGVIEPGNDITFKNASNVEVNEKTFTVTNTGNATIESYAVLLQDLIVTYASEVRVDENTTIPAGTSTSLNSPSDFRITLTCTSSLGNPCLGVTESDDISLADIGAPLIVNSIEADEVHTYSLKMHYKETGYDQSGDMNKSFSAKVNISNNAETASLAFVVPNASEGDYAELHSEKQTNSGFYDANTQTKTYVFTGVEPETHTLTIKQSNGTEKLQKQIAIENGETLSTKTEDGVPTITVGKTERKVIVPISTAGEITLNSVTAETNKSELTGVTVNLLAASSGDKQINGLKLYESLDAAYNDLQSYLGVEFIESSSGGYQTYTPSKIPRQIVWTVYGEVNFDTTKISYPYPTSHANAQEIVLLSGGLYVVWPIDATNNLGANPIEKITMIGGNASASINHTNENIIEWPVSHAEPTTVEIDGIKFKNFINLTQYDETELILKNCTFEDGIQVQSMGTVTVKNNIFNYGKSYLDSRYAVILLNGTTTTNVIFEGNTINGYPRGINVDTSNTITDVTIRNNTFKNITHETRAAVQLTRAKSIIIDNNNIENVKSNAFWFYANFSTPTTTITNNTITNTGYLAMFGDDSTPLDHTTLNITSSNNTVNVLNPGYGISKNNIKTANTFTLN